MASGVQSKLCLFADDCIIYRTINSSSDHTILQHDFNLILLTNWAKTWQMEINVHKSNSLQISNIYMTKAHYIYIYSIYIYMLLNTNT